MQVDSGLKMPAPLDLKVCSHEIIQNVLDASNTDAGKEAGCSDIMALIFQDKRPKYSAVCNCSRVLDVELANVYDTRYDCVLRPGIWNVKEVSDTCRRTELARRTPTPASNSVLTSNYSCEPGVTCVHGVCDTHTSSSAGEGSSVSSGSVCRCEEGVGSLRWEPVHPLWIGAACARPWCPNECSGHGHCNVLTGECVCDSTFIGEACDVPHFETQITTANSGKLENPPVASTNGTIEQQQQDTAQAPLRPRNIDSFKVEPIPSTSTENVMQESTH
jgi:hypothetical protein